MNLSLSFGYTCFMSQFWKVGNKQTKRMCVPHFEDKKSRLGGFPIEIKTKIRYLIICCYHNFIL